MDDKFWFLKNCNLFERLTPEQIVDRLDANADAFGVTNLWSFSWPLVREIIGKMKERFPDKPIVCGGEHFTGLPDFSMEQAPLDFIVLGEGQVRDSRR